MNNLITDAETAMTYLANGYMPTKHTEFVVNTIGKMIDALGEVTSEVVFTPDFDVNESTLRGVIVESLEDISSAEVAELPKVKPSAVKVVSKSQDKRVATQRKKK